MVLKKRYFTKDKKKVGKKSGKPRGKYNVAHKVPVDEAIIPSVLPASPQEPKLPSNSRSITERPVWLAWLLSRQGRVTAFLLVLLALAMWQAVLLAQSGTVLYSVLRERAQLQADMRLWQSISREYPTYRDANFQVAVTAYQLNDEKVARQYVQKVLAIDPSYIPGVRLAQQLGVK